MNYFTGIVTGILFKDNIVGLLGNVITHGICVYHKVCPSKKVEKENKIFLVCKITNEEIFNEFFPVLRTKFRTQPHWVYHEHKDTIKLELEWADNFNNFDEILEKSGLDIPFFRKFSELYVYIHYFSNGKEYINVYQSGSIIGLADFVVKETGYSIKYNNLICATFMDSNGKQEYITKYFKMFANNKDILTPEILLLNYDKLNTLDVKLTLIKDKEVVVLNLNESI